MRDETSRIVSLLGDENVDYDLLKDRIINQPYNKMDDPYDSTGDDDDSDERSDLPSGSSKSNSDTPVLDNFGIDLTKAAEENRLDPVVGREVEIERLAQILSRRKKNNPVLIGEPGVGKSAIVEGMAIRIVKRQVSRVLFNKRVITLDLASIVAGTKYRGQFEERIKAILNELSKTTNVILFIDEIHTSLAQVVLLAPLMLQIVKTARKEIQCIELQHLMNTVAYRKMVH